MGDKVAPYGLSGVITRGSTPPPPSKALPEGVTLDDVPEGVTLDEPTQLDPRGRPYDPRFAPEPQPEDRLGRAARQFREATAGLQQQRQDLAQPPSTAHAALGGVLAGATANTLPMITAAIAHPISALPGGDRSAYTNERNDIQASLDADREAHPYAFGAGELGGTALTSTILPGGGKALGRIAQAVALGGVGSAADTLGHGGTFGEAAKSGAIGGAVAGALGGVGELVGKGISSALGKKAGSKTAQEAFEQETLRDFASDSRPKDRRALSDLFSRDVEKQPIAAPTIAPKDILYTDGFKPVLELAKKGEREQVATELEKISSKLNAQKVPNYAAVDAAKPLAVGKVDQDLGTAIFKLEGEHGSAPVVKALKEARQRVQDTWKSTDVGRLRDTLERFAGGDMSTDAQKAATNEVLGKLPASGYVTRADLVKAMGAHVEDPKLQQLVIDAPSSFHPELTRPLADLRSAVTKAQDDAFDTLGTIAETEHAKLKDAIRSNLNRSLETHLNDVARLSPELEKTVTNIRNSDVVQSTVLALAKNNEEAMNAGVVKDIGRAKKGHLVSNLVGAEQLGQAGLSLLSGEPVKAAKHVGIAALSKIAPEALHGVGRDITEASARALQRGTGPMAALLKAAQSGNARAQELLAKLKLTGIGSDLRQAGKTAAKVQAAKTVIQSQPAQQVGTAVNGYLGGDQ